MQDHHRLWSKQETWTHRILFSCQLQDLDRKPAGCFRVPFLMTGAPLTYSTPSSESASWTLLEVNGVSTAVSLKLLFLSPGVSAASPVRFLSAALWASLSVESLKSRPDAPTLLDMLRLARRKLCFRVRGSTSRDGSVHWYEISSVSLPSA